MHPDPAAWLADGASRSARLHDVAGARARLSRQPRGCRKNSRSGEPKGRRQGKDRSRHVEAAQATARGRPHPDLLGRFAGTAAELYIYNRQDVAVERELHQHPKLQALPASEQDTWVLDAEINDRGVRIDAPLAAAASRLAAQALADLNERMRQETDGAVDTATKNEKLKAWLASQGVKLPRKQRKGKSGCSGKPASTPTISRSSWPEICRNARVRAALEIRLQAAQSAASKIDRMLRTRCADGRVRGLFKFHGATTGRWSGAGFQPQNLKRPELLQDRRSHRRRDQLVKAEDYAALKKSYGDVLGVIGDLCRSMIIPAPGHRFIVGDFSAIEARVLAFLAGDADKLEAFRQFDLRPRARHLLRHGRAGSRARRRAGQVARAAARENLRARARVLDGGRQAAGHDPEGQRSHRCGHHPRGRGTMGANMARQEPAHRRILGAARMQRRWRRCAILECLSLAAASVSRCATACFRCACRPGAS